MESTNGLLLGFRSCRGWWRWGGLMMLWDS